MTRLESLATQIIDQIEQIKLLEAEVKQLKKELYFLENETLAKEFFSIVAGEEEDKTILEKRKLLENKEKKLVELHEKMEGLERNFLERLASITFPIDRKGIEEDGGKVTFCFSSPVPKTIEVMSYLLNLKPLTFNQTTFTADKITTSATNASEGMRKVIAAVKKLRETASAIRDATKFADDLASRDKKIQVMLSVMYKEGKELTYAEIEERGGFETGALRGVLYHVLKNNPYIEKVSRGTFRLTEIGRRVLQEFDRKYGLKLKAEG